MKRTAFRGQVSAPRPVVMKSVRGEANDSASPPWPCPQLPAVRLYFSGPFEGELYILINSKLPLTGFPKCHPVWIRCNGIQSLINVLYLHAAVWGLLNSEFRCRKHVPHISKGLPFLISLAARPIHTRCQHGKVEILLSLQLPVLSTLTGICCQLHLYQIHKKSCIVMFPSNSGKIYWWLRCLS